MFCWLTYRKNFLTELPNTSNHYNNNDNNNYNTITEGGLRSDAGWGCMVRVAQMMLCEAVKLHQGYKDLELFLDIPEAAFSVHRVCLEANKQGK